MRVFDLKLIRADACGNGRFNCSTGSGYALAEVVDITAGAEPTESAETN
jgi:hypothetical protein